MAKAATMAPQGHTLVFAKSISSGKLVIEPIDARGSHAPLQVAREIANVISNISFHIFLANSSYKPVRVPKRRIVAKITNIPSHIVATETAFLETVPKTIGAVHYRPSVDRDTQETRHKEVEARDDENLRLHWDSKVQPSNEYAEYRDQLPNILSKVRSLWVVHVGQVCIAKQRIELTSDNTNPAHSARYRAQLRAKEFEKADNDKMLPQKFIEPAQTKLAGPIVFAQNRRQLSTHLC